MGGSEGAGIPKNIKSEIGGPVAVGGDLGRARHARVRARVERYERFFSTTATGRRTLEKHGGGG